MRMKNDDFIIIRIFAQDSYYLLKVNKVKYYFIKSFLLEKIKKVKYELKSRLHSEENYLIRCEKFLFSKQIYSWDI